MLGQAGPASRASKCPPGTLQRATEELMEVTEASAQTAVQHCEQSSVTPLGLRGLSHAALLWVATE